MKSKIMIGILLGLLAVSLILNGLLLSKNNSSYIKIPGEKITSTENSYECIKNIETNSENSTETNIHNIDFDGFGTVLKIEINYQRKYFDLEEYNEKVKMYKSYDIENYIYDEKNQMIISTYETDYTKTDNNQEQDTELWIKNLINNYIENGFTCDLK